MLREVYSVEVLGGFLSSHRLFFILLLAQALKNLLAIGKLIAFLPTKMGEEPHFFRSFDLSYFRGSFQNMFQELSSTSCVGHC